MPSEGEELGLLVKVACERLGRRPLMGQPQPLSITNSRENLFDLVETAVKKLGERPYMDAPNGTQ